MIVVPDAEIREAGVVAVVVIAVRAPAWTVDHYRAVSVDHKPFALAGSKLANMTPRLGDHLYASRWVRVVIPLPTKRRGPVRNPGCNMAPAHCCPVLQCEYSVRNLVELARSLSTLVPLVGV